MLNVIRHNVIMPNIIMLNVIMLSVIMLSVILLKGIMLNVVAPNYGVSNVHLIPRWILVLHPNLFLIVAWYFPFPGMESATAKNK